MPKPRTNAETAQYWADSILASEPAPDLTVNSVIVSRDTVYSFGSHYPMGKIFRNEDGSVRRVVVTSDHYPHRGWAKTPEDQSAVESGAREACAKAKVRLEFAPLSDYKLRPNGVRCKPKDSDPELAHPYITVPRPFVAANPGPEPVKSNEGCIAGKVEEYSYQVEASIFVDETLGAQPDAHLVDRQLRPTDYVTWHRIGANYKSLRARRAANGFIYWGTNRSGSHWGQPQDEQWTEFESTHKGADIHFKQCPHCEAFNDLHRGWSTRYHGGYRRDEPGYALYAKCMDEYGSMEAWREAYREDWRRVVAGRKYIKAWTARNFIPLSAVSRDSDGIPILDENGHAMRKDSERYFKRQRELERAERRRQREREEQERIRRHARRLYERRQARIQRRHEQSFIGTAERVANELRSIRLELAGNTTDERES
jgi:hypothetical protein